MTDGSKMADDFLTGTRSAACGGTTTVIPFACQLRGQSLADAVADYHRRAEGKAAVDYAFHLIVSDPTPQLLQQELPMLVAQGCSSLKLYMTYDDLRLDDRQILQLLAVARREGALTMIHAENADCIAWLSEQLVSAGLGAPRYHAHARPMLVEREATHRAIALAELADVPVLIVHVSGREAVAQIREAQAPGPEGLCRDLSAVPVADRGRSGVAGLRRRQVHLQPAAARQGQPAGDLERAGERHVPGAQRPTMPPSRWARRARPWPARTRPSTRVPTASPGWRRGCRCS